MSAPGPYPSKGRSPAVKKASKKIAEQYGCIVTGHTENLTAAHLPYRQADGAGWGLLEFVPLRIDLHRRYDENDPLIVEIVNLCAARYYAMMLREHPKVYLGPDWRIEEVRGQDC